MRIAIVNGPNLNLLGKREKDIYGDISFEDFFDEIVKIYPDHNFSYMQSNVEGEIVNLLHEADLMSDGIILNAAGYTHTSVSIADAVAGISTPVIEVHISNILAREEFRHTSLIASGCAGSLFGFGLNGYRLAIEAFVKSLI